MTKHNVTQETVLGSEIVNNLLSDLSNGKKMNSKVAKQFIVALFEELNVPLSQYEIQEIEKYHLTKKVTAQKLQRLIINMLPNGMKNEFLSEESN